MGLAFDDWDIDFYTNLFREKMKRNPTDVELFDLAQSNSEHSRHWFFGGHQVIDGEQKEKSLFHLIYASSFSIIFDNLAAVYSFNETPTLQFMITSEAFSTSLLHCDMRITSPVK